MVIIRPLLLPLVFLVLMAGCAEGSNPSSGDPLLWTAISPNGSAGWLFGTLHQGVSLHGDLSGSILEKLQLADGLTLEADTRDVSGQELLTMIRLPADQQLDSLLPGSTWTTLIELIPDVPASTLRTLRPWYVSSLLVQILTPSESRLEDELLAAASSSQKKLFFLETWQSQVTLMNTLSQDRALDQLIALVRNASEASESIRALIAAYRGGDLESITRAGLAAGAFPAMGSPEYEPLLRDRNQAWLPLIEEQLASGTAFIAVGFGHLLGTDGLLEMLGAEGYSVSRAH